MVWVPSQNLPVRRFFHFSYAPYQTHIQHDSIVFRLYSHHTLFGRWLTVILTCMCSYTVLCALRHTHILALGDFRDVASCVPMCMCVYLVCVFVVCRCWHSHSITTQNPWSFGEKFSGYAYPHARNARTYTYTGLLMHIIAPTQAFGRGVGFRNENVPQVEKSPQPIHPHTYDISTTHLEF